MLPRTTSRLGAGVLSVMALAFGGGGLVALYWAASTVLTWQRMANWEAVPAQLIALNLEEHRGDDSTTYKAVATFRYRYAGRDYESSRVAISSGSDNIGDFQHRLYDELRSAQTAGKPVTAYVDPANPAEATLNRELRGLLLVFQLAFGVLFGGVGFGLLFAARYGTRRIAEEQALRARFPNEPWRWRPEWATNRIRGSNRARAYMTLGFAVIWNLISTPAVLLVPRDGHAGLLVSVVVMLFPLVGIGLAVWAVRAWWQWQRFRVVTFDLTQMPVALGGRVRGAIRVGTAVPVDREFRLELCCSERRTTGRDNESSERLLWQTQVGVPRSRCEISSGFTQIPVDVAVPAEQPATTTGDESTAIRWYLDVTGECPGPDFWSRFELPVFDVGATRAALEPAAPTADASERPDRRRLATLGIDYSTLPGGGERWIFKRARNLGAAVGLTLLTGVWTAISAGLFTVDAPVVIPVAFAAFDVVLLWWVSSMWLTEYRVTLERGALTLTKRRFLNSAPVEIPLHWIRSASTKRGMQAGNKLYYDVRIETVEGAYTAASEIDDYNVASWLAGYWRTGGKGSDQIPAR